MILLSERHIGFESKENKVFFGSEHHVAMLEKTLADSPASLLDNIEKYLGSISDFTAGIIETDKHILAWTDHIKSKPLFYFKRDTSFYISDTPQMIAKKFNLNDFGHAQQIEFSMSGYVSGNRTLLPEVSALQPGEFILWSKETCEMVSKRYFLYTPTYSSVCSWEENAEELGNVFDDLIKKVITNSNGKTIWVPLSAGLDSRILLCKLHEHGYKNIQTFTYGPKFNFEALYAKKIAKKLNIPWRMITLKNEDYRALFDDDIRFDFWNFADNLKTIPCMREFSAIHFLYKNKLAQPGDIFLNGQSGDYISGGHIPDIWCEKTHVSRKEFLNQILNKNYALWPNLLNNENRDVVASLILSLIPEKNIENTIDCKTACKYHEQWEYDGRQTTYVVNGQRIYEYFGYKWEMPLWEKKIVLFFQNISLEQKRSQALYKKYLKEYNYEGLFPDKEPYIWRWPIDKLWVVLVAQIIGRIRGREQKNNYYSYMSYFGHYANQFSFFRRSEHKRNYKEIRNVVSLYVREWIENNSSKFSSKILAGLKIEKTPKP